MLKNAELILKQRVSKVVVTFIFLNMKMQDASLQIQSLIIILTQPQTLSLSLSPLFSLLRHLSFLYLSRQRTPPFCIRSEFT
jgi:hypothetical protein